MKHLRAWTLAAAFGCLALPAGQAAAQDYPTRPIEIIVGFQPGSASDIALRLMADELAKELGQPMVVINQPGAAGQAGAKACADAKPDGYTLCTGNEGTHVTGPVLKKDIPYDPVKDFAPITQTYRSTMGIAVNPDVLPVSTVDELIKFAKENPGKVKFGTSGVGGPQHLAGELLKQRTGIEMTHVSYNGAAPAVSDLVSGYLPMVISTLPAMLAQQQTGKVKIIAIGNAERRSDMPETPIISETVPDFVVEGWSGFFAPAGTDPAIIAKLNAAFVTTLNKDNIKDALAKISVDPVGSSPETLAKLIEDNLVRWKQVVELAGIQPQ
jgi:tripartite-type tricarboxylate transporter receptor subunit TctC